MSRFSSSVFAWVLLLFSAATWTACQEGHAPANTVPDPAPEAQRPGLPLPEGLDIRVDGRVAGSLLNLQVNVDIPDGSYVISAMSDRDYLGKFQVSFSDSTVQPMGSLTESPVSIPGWEPWDQVYTPMLFSSTEIQQSWILPTGRDTLKGQVFFVLEPQCVPYALDFRVLPRQQQITSGLVHPEYPD